MPRTRSSSDSSVNTEERLGILLKQRMQGARETDGPEAAPGLAVLDDSTTGAHR